MHVTNPLCIAAVTVSIVAGCMATRPLAAQSTQLAATPPMGWNSWNHFATKVTDADVRALPPTSWCQAACA